MNLDYQSRWHSPVLWTAIVAVIIRVGMAFLKQDIDDTTIGAITGYILDALIVFGIVNNPENSKGL